MNRIEYWNDVCRKNLRQENDGYTVGENWPKVRAITERMMRYDLLDKDVLEIGTGFGFVAAAMSAVSNFRTYRGIDISHEFAKAANDMFGLNVRTCDALTAEFDIKFDAVLLFDVLEHIDKSDRSAIYEKIFSVLNPGGLIFINNPLNESRHTEFDFGFNYWDLMFLSSSQKLIIKHLEEYSIQRTDRRYQFIVLAKEDK